MTTQQLYGPRWGSLRLALIRYVCPSPMRMRRGIRRQLSVYSGITDQARVASSQAGEVQMREEKRNKTLL